MPWASRCASAIGLAFLTARATTAGQAKRTACYPEQNLPVLVISPVR